MAWWINVIQYLCHRMTSLRFKPLFANFFNSFRKLYICILCHFSTLHCYRLLKSLWKTRTCSSYSNYMVADRWSDHTITPWFWPGLPWIILTPHSKVNPTSDSPLYIQDPILVITVAIDVSAPGHQHVQWWLHRDYFVYAPSHWETTLQCNVVSHWLGAFIKWSLTTKLDIVSSQFLWLSTIFSNIFWERDIM